MLRSHGCCDVIKKTPTVGAPHYPCKEGFAKAARDLECAPVRIATSQPLVTVIRVIKVSACSPSLYCVCVCCTVMAVVQIHHEKYCACVKATIIR